jgi:hypothetical protein
MYMIIYDIHCKKNLNKFCIIVCDIHCKFFEGNICIVAWNIIHCKSFENNIITILKLGRKIIGNLCFWSILLSHLLFHFRFLTLIVLSTNPLHSLERNQNKEIIFF